MAENIQAYIGVAGGLILMYLILTNWEGFKAIINSLALGNVAAVSALQGRPFTYGNFSAGQGAPSSRAPK
jgi:hypothetical protein